MVAMGVRDDDTVETGNLRSAQLLATVGTTIAEHALATAFDHDRGPGPLVARCVSVALAPFVPNLRHAGRRPTAENSDLHAALRNSLKKLPVVESPSCSRSSPRRSATNAAVSATTPGSHFWPRCGTGARKG